MPETNKVHQREEASFKAEEPGIGAKKAARFLAELSAPQAETAPQRPEPASQTPKASDETPPEAREEKSIDAFAESVASSLEQAGMEIDHKDGLPEHSENARHEKDTGFLGDWESFDEIHELSSEQEIVEEPDDLQPFEGVEGLRTLSELALASEADGGPDLSSKHDELADAVQAALLSVYGEAPSALPGDEGEALTHSPDLNASGPGWASDDNLSPQDVILNYFDYQPATRTGRTMSRIMSVAMPGMTAAALSTRLWIILRLSIGRSGHVPPMGTQIMTIRHPIPFPQAIPRPKRQRRRMSGKAAVFSERRPSASSAALP